MIVVNNLAPDDSIAIQFAKELSAALDGALYTELPYSRDSFSSMAPDIIINIDFPQSLDPNASGYTVLSYSDSQLAEVIRVSLSRQVGLASATDTGKAALANAPYGLQDDVTIILGYANSSYDAAWYSSTGNRELLVDTLVNLINGDYSAVNHDAEPMVTLVADPYFLSTTESVVYDSLYGFPVRALVLNQNYYELDVVYTESRDHILSFMAKPLESDTSLIIYVNGSRLVEVPILGGSQWFQYTFMEIPSGATIRISTAAQLLITAIMLAPEAVFGGD